MKLIAIIIINKIYFLLYIIFGQVTLVYTQSDTMHQEQFYEMEGKFGSIINHSPAYKPTVTEPSYGTMISYGYRPKSASPFFEKFNYPSLIFSGHYSKFGDADIFGNAIGAIAYLNFYHVENKKIQLQTKVGLGLGYVTKTYTESPINNVIGSHFNFSVNAEFYGQYNLSKNIALLGGVGLLHYSNGHTILPNLGINFGYGRLGMRYYIDNSFSKSEFKVKEDLYFQDKNVINIGLGMSDKGDLNNHAILPTYSLSYHRRIHTGRFNALLAGASVEYKNDELDYKIYGFDNNSDIAIVVGDELIFGRVSFNAAIGIYLYSVTQSQKFTYQRYSFNYELPLSTQKFHIGVGAQIKTHLGAAELMEFKIFTSF